MLAPKQDSPLKSSCCGDIRYAQGGIRFRYPMLRPAGSIHEAQHASLQNLFFCRVAHVFEVGRGQSSGQMPSISTARQAILGRLPHLT